MALISKLQAIADAIRFKTNKIGQLTLDEMPNEILSISGGGSSDVPFPLGGVNAELVSEYNEDWTLADTSFVKGESASTSATSILGSIAQRFVVPNYTYANKDVVAVQSVNVEVEHEEGATNTARTLKSSYVVVSWASKRKTTDTSEKTTRQVFSNSTTTMVKYLNSSGNTTRGIALYGFYGTPQAPTFGSATNNTTTFRFASPILYYRASSTYESVANIKLVKDVKWHWNVKVYVVDSMTTPTSAINDIQDSWLTD